MSFLDVWVKRDGEGGFTTEVYRKKTHSNRYLNFGSNHPLEHKLSGMKTLVHRATIYCSNGQLFRQELKHLRDTFLENGYDPKVVKKVLRSKVDVSQRQEMIENLLEDVDKEKEEEEVYGDVIVPYVKEINSKLLRVCRKLELKMVNRRTTNLRSLLVKTRPPVEFEEKKNVIYRVPCGNCEKAYVGQTKRPWKVRRGEHKTSIKKYMRGEGTGSDDYNDWGIPNHCMETDFEHDFDFENTTYLARERHLGRRLVLESLFISLEEDSVNTKEGREVGEVWGIILKEYQQQLGYFQKD